MSYKSIKQEWMNDLRPGNLISFKGNVVIVVKIDNEKLIIKDTKTKEEIEIIFDLSN